MTPLRYLALAALPLALTTTAAAQTAPPDRPASLSALAGHVTIPYDRFTLPNGLTVLVHTDRKAPIVAVSVWYRIGSKNEPQGKTGFAHLFEHLMFNGSEHAPGDYFEPLQQIGATDFNGTTWFDRTNYFETVPTGALDRVLMLESDRMGFLLGAVTQEKLDNQRGVVQNEKRQGDNQPFGLVEYEELENLYPSGHPYHHSTIGSMADLDAASLADVKQWFTDNYGPNNSVLVLAGDIDLATARAKVEKWFGGIPAGPAIKPIEVSVPTLPAPVAKTIKDSVPTTRIYRFWAVPGLDNPDYIPLTMSASVLGGLASSRLDNDLVRGRQLAVAVSASADIFAQAGQFVIYADVKPGTDPAEVARALDEDLARFIAEGPTADELQRAATVYTAGQIRGLDNLGGFSGKAPTLAEGLIYSNDPAHYRKELDTIAGLDPATVRAVTAKWLSRPAFALTVEPGTRTEGGESRGGFVTGKAAGAPVAGPAFWRSEDGDGASADAEGTPAAAPDRTQLPPLGTLAPLDFPDIQRATLSNGMQVYFARRDTVPLVTVQLTFDAGYAADPKDALGTQSLMLQLMNEGTTTLDATQLAVAKERLGAQLGSSADLDLTNFTLNVPAANFGAGLDLLADYVLHPAFSPQELERVRVQQLNRIQGELKDPTGIARRAYALTLFGKDHPYGVPPTGTGDAAAVQKLTAAQLAAFHDAWLRPDRARVVVVGDTTLAAVTAQLEKAFGGWKAPAGPAPVKNFAAPIPVQTPRVILIDRPASPQSVIYAGRVLAQKGSDDLTDLTTANEVFGASFLSRINMNLRETKGWSYGVRSTIQRPLERAVFTITAPVQADRTGDSIAELIKEFTGFTGPAGITAEELERTVNGDVRSLPGEFETGADVLGGIDAIVKYKRPDSYYETLADTYRAMTAAQLDGAFRSAVAGSPLVFLVVGDASVVRPQLDQLKLPVEVVPVAQIGGAP